MEKEKVTEELVRQNGNQAAAVMADFAGGGGGGSLSDYLTLCAELQWRAHTSEDLAKLPSSHPRIGAVADLPDGKIPLISYETLGDFPEYGELNTYIIGAITPVGESEIEYYDVTFLDGDFGLITRDRTLLFKAPVD